ncbi:MAG: hypothetical protein IT166_18460 [Bryobacterales bacterium]|nr:hypothetical protein [Bryobacterales bacterium]
MKGIVEAMKFFPIPDPRSGGVTKQMLADLRQAGILPNNIGAFASEQNWIEATGVGAPSDGAEAKYWRDNATIWQNTTDTFRYLMIDRAPDGGITRMPLNFSDSTFSIYSLETAQFYRQYAKHFPVIPRLVLKTMNRYDAGRMNFSPGPPVDYPLGILLADPTGPLEGFRATFPSNMALRFNPQNGQPEAFYWADYVREYPFDWTPTVPAAPGGVQKLSDEELVSAAGGIVGSAMTVKEKALAIRQLAAR